MVVGKFISRETSPFVGNKFPDYDYIRNADFERLPIVKGATPSAIHLPKPAFQWVLQFFINGLKSIICVSKSFRLTDAYPLIAG
jgi:hypothetical protein